MGASLTYGDISPRTVAKVVKELLPRGQHEMVLEKFGTVHSISRGETKSIKWRRYNSLPTDSASPLAEGIIPEGYEATTEDITAILKQYGGYIPTTDVIMDTHEDPILKEFSLLCIEQGKEIIEKVRYAVAKGGSNVYYAAGVASRSLVNSKITLGDVRKVIRGFHRNKARVISEIIKPSPNYATTPVAPAFFAICSTDIEPDIRNLTGFSPVEDYANSSMIMPGEIGKVEKTRFVGSAIYEPWLQAGVSGTTYISNGGDPGSGAKADVYPVLFFAKNSLGIVPFSGQKSIQLAIVNPKPSPSDPLGQKGSVGWKAYQASARLNELWIARLEVGATYNPTT